MSSRGFTLIELIVAASLLLSVTAAIAALAIPARDAVGRSITQDEMNGGVRVVLDQIATDIREAGSGAAIVNGVRLGDVTAVVEAFADLDAEAPVESGRAIRLVSVAREAPQGVLRENTLRGSTTTRLETASRCSDIGIACGMEPDTDVVLYDQSRAAFLTVTAVAPPNRVTFGPALSDDFAAGASLAAVTTLKYGVRADPDGAQRLVRVSNGGVEQPLVHHVVDFEVVMQPEAVSVRIRVEAANAEWRGAATELFRRPGNARHAARWVPDLELRAVVALRSVSP